MGRIVLKDVIVKLWQISKKYKIDNYEINTDGDVLSGNSVYMIFYANF